MTGERERDMESDEFFISTKLEDNEMIVGVVLSLRPGSRSIYNDLAFQIAKVRWAIWRQVFLNRGWSINFL